MIVRIIRDVQMSEGQIIWAVLYYVILPFVNQPINSLRFYNILVSNLNQN